MLAIFSCMLFGQDTINTKDAKGLRQGYWRKVDSVGRLIYEGRFRDGIPIGEFLYYYPDGKLKTVSKVSSQGRRASTISYFPGGKKMAVGNYLDEKKDSLWQFYSEFTGNVVSSDTYQNGVINGESKVFYPEGELSEIQIYKDGVKDGPWEQYFPDGKLKLRGSFNAGDKEGKFKAFYNSGIPMITGQYFQGHQDGTWVYYDEKGTMARQEVYNKGRLISQIPEPTIPK
jgi:antitoxin component YwqK of YwqJK toxin-antitoxin module